MHRLVTDILWATATVYIALVILRELSILSADVGLPSISRGLEFGIGTGGSGAGTGA